jgi:isopenicillin N synthase-like dioxygenase
MAPIRDSGSLPIINIVPFLNNQPKDAVLQEKTAAALHKACIEYGFFYLDISAYVDASVPETLVDLAREFFALPQEEKDKLALANEDHARGVWLVLIFHDRRNHRVGYARLKENVMNGKADNHEDLDLYKPIANPDKTKPLWGKNQWPTVPGFREKYKDWIAKMKALGMIVMHT